MMTMDRKFRIVIKEGICYEVEISSELILGVALFSWIGHPLALN